MATSTSEAPEDPEASEDPEALEALEDSEDSEKAPSLPPELEKQLAQVEREMREAAQQVQREEDEAPRDPSDAPGDLMLGDTRVWEEKMRNAMNDGLTPDMIEQIYTRAEELYSEFAFKEAELLFSMYGMLAPSDHRGMGGLASIYLERKEYERALELLVVLQRMPTSNIEDTFLNTALCLYKLERHEEASAALLMVDETKLPSEFYAKRYAYLKKQLNKYLGDYFQARGTKK